LPLRPFEGLASVPAGDPAGGLRLGIGCHAQRCQASTGGSAVAVTFSPGSGPPCRAAQQAASILHAGRFVV